MLKKVLFACALYGAGSAAAEEAWLLGSGCYKQSFMRDIIELTGDEGMMLMVQYIQDGKCAPTVMTQSDWDSGPKIRDTGVKAAYASVHNWADGSLPDRLPPKQVMYFDTTTETESND